MEFDILVKNATIVTMNPRREILTNSLIGIQNDRIQYLGKAGNGPQLNAVRTIDAKGEIVLPGFVNCHTHAIQVLLRGGISQDKSLIDWLMNVLLPGLSSYTPDDARLGATLYCIESIRSGITTFLDNADASQDWDIAASTLDTYRNLGVRAIYGRMFLDKMPEIPGDYMDSIRRKHSGVTMNRNFHEDSDTALDSIESLINEYHEGTSGLIQVWPAPAMPMFVSQEGLLGSLKLANQHDTGITIHLAESPMEHLTHEMSPVEYLANIGFLSERLVAAHCVHINERDIRVLKMNGVKVASLPVSNLYLGSGIAPIPQMIAHGLTVSLGTDDANCNDSINMISDMKFLALIHRGISEDSAVLTSEQVLEIATIGGATALGIEKEVGSIEVGKKADLLILDNNQPQMVPHHHLPACIVYQAYGSEINTVIVNGKIMLENGELNVIPMEEELKIYRNAQSKSVGIAKKCGIKINRGWKTSSF